MAEAVKYLTAAPIFVFFGCYAYSYMYLKRILGEYLHLASLQDYITLGAAAVPSALIVVLAALPGTIRDALRGPKPFQSDPRQFELMLSRLEAGRKPFPWYSKLLPVAAIAVLLVLFFGVVASVLATGRFFPAALVVIVMTWNFWPRPERGDHPALVKFLMLVYTGLVILAVTSGFDDASRALQKRQGETNTFRTTWRTTEADLITTISAGYVIRSPDGRVSLRAHDGSVTIFLYKYDVPERHMLAGAQDAVRRFLGTM
jgi:hypothetical protein